MSSPRKFRVWDGEEMYFPHTSYRTALHFHGRGWELKKWWRTRQERLVANSHIDEHALMQYTGFTDAEGTEIYEGDVVDIVFQSDGDSRGVVTWDNEKGRWQIEYGGYESYTNPLAAPARNWQPRVIGNRYENPDLLKEPA